MKDIQIFRHDMFGEIRTMSGTEGEPLFVGKDVATALGYINPSNAIQTHVDKEDKTTYLIQVSGSNYKSRTLFINESGLYSLILSSKLPQARAFKRWVMSEVLPQIRRTGGYIPTRDAEGRRLGDEDTVARALQIRGRTLRQMNADNYRCLTATEVARSWVPFVLQHGDCTFYAEMIQEQARKVGNAVARLLLLSATMGEGS